MQSPLERHLDAHLARIVHRIRHLRQFDLSKEEDCEEALEESLEALRTLALYRGILKNAAEQSFQSSNATFYRTLSRW